MNEAAQFCVHLWDDTNKRWVKAQCDTDGNLLIDTSNLNLGDLGNVAVSGVADADFLVYSAAAGKWIPLAHKDTITGVHGVGASQIASLADIIATPIDTLAAPSDNTLLDVSTDAHGLCPKLDNVVTNFLNGQGAFSTPPALTVTAGDLLVSSADVESSNNTTTYTKRKEFSVLIGGTYRVKFDLKQQNSSYIAYGTIYKNGVAFGIEHTTQSLSYVTFSEDLEFTAGDLIQLYVKSSGYLAYWRNCRLYVAAFSKITVTLD